MGCQDEGDAGAVSYRLQAGKYFLARYNVHTCRGFIQENDPRKSNKRHTNRQLSLVATTRTRKRPVKDIN